MRIEIKTTTSFFALGLGWKNDTTHEWRVDIIVGCLAICFYWKKDMKDF